MKSCLFLLLALSAAALVSGRVLEDEAPGRSLQQLSSSALCPDGCNRAGGGCIQDNTAAGLRCQLCLGNLLVNKVNGKCSCPPGKFAEVINGVPQCTDCTKSRFCVGGDFNATAVTPTSEACPANMTTVGKRSTSNRACVQNAGYFYTIDANSTVGAEICPVDTYSPGLKKQRACVPCPTGFTTNGTTGNTRPTNCLVPAGYYLKAPGQVAPCPKGEYKEDLGPAANCTKCAFGVTTNLLVPGYYAKQMDGEVVTESKICPQGFYCPGGIPPSASPFNASMAGRRLHQTANFSGDTVFKCDGDVLTVDIGSYAPEQCLVAPGYYYNSTTMIKCPAGSYRADWLPKEQATSCISCGEGVKATTTDQIKRWDITDEFITFMEPVTTSSDDCYIQAGQGLYYTFTTATWRARNCNSNTYGVSNITYGLTPAPCKDCPTNMVANNNATEYPTSAAYWVNNTDGTNGFISALACVTQDGFGYNGRIAQACAQGKYNAKDNYLDCQSCPYGMTTQNVGAGIKQDDCGVAAGFGWVDGKVDLCPIGTYNNDTWDSGAYAGREAANCTLCPDGTTTAQSGSNSDGQCSLCQLGRGGVACNQTCGGDTDKALAGFYGPPGRSTTTDPECIACTTQQTGYSFSWQFTNDVYNVSSISPVGANASTDCLAKYSQTFDGAWYMPIDPAGAATVIKNGTSTPTAVTSFAGCVAECDKEWNTTQPCQYITYDYITQQCYLRRSNIQTIVGAPVIGYKAAPSGDVGTNAWSVDPAVQEAQKKKNAAAKMLASGRYTFYQDPLALQVGTGTYPAGQVGQVAPANRNSFTKWQDCLNACDDDVGCTAFIIQITVAVADRPKTCILVYGVYDVAEFKRSFVRADINRLYDISGVLK